MAKRFAEAADRNRHVILPILREWLPDPCEVLEIASGSGQHAVHFGAGLPGVTWQPSEASEEALDSIRHHVAEAALDNVRPPVRLDVTATDWPVARCDAIVNVNMIHATPFACCEGLFSGAAHTLRPGGLLVLYGPFRRGQAFTTESNARFDAALRARDPAWGIRDLERVQALAAGQGLRLTAVRDTPVNNFTVRFERG